MLKLHGSPVSLFYCIVKQALQEKGMVFEEVVVLPNQEPAFLAISPMGKIPALETECGHLTETNVIVEYLDELQPIPALYPHDAFARAKVKQLIKMVELYIEAPAHQWVPVLRGAPLPDYLRETTRPVLGRGFAALGLLACFAPWVCGEQFTAADIFLYRSLLVAVHVAGTFYDWDVCSDIPGLEDWRRRMAERPLTKAIDAEMNHALRAFMPEPSGA